MLEQSYRHCDYILNWKEFCVEVKRENTHSVNVIVSEKTISFHIVVA